VSDGRSGDWFTDVDGGGSSSTTPPPPDMEFQPGTAGVSRSVGRRCQLLL